MNTFKRVTFLFVLASAVAMGQETGPFTLRDSFSSVKPFDQVIARSSRLPIQKRYSEMTKQEQAVLKEFYTEMGEQDEPPYPVNGMEPVLRAIHQAQAKLLVEGDLYLVVDVSSTGEATTVKVYGSPSPEMTRFVSTVLLLEKYKPAVCGGRPCSQSFPFPLRFVLR